MARSPLQLSDAQKAEVETLAAVLTTEQIADFFGIGRRTFYDLMARDEEIAARYKKGKARAIGAIAQTLISKARAGDTTSMIFYLKTQAGWRETAGLALSVAAPPEQDHDEAFQVFANHLNQLSARLGQDTAVAKNPVIVDAAAASAVELR
ncbi:MAG: helix-turn-helix domain-containing protein [Candidatus Saccharibacteria bacterium]|nr:helix-turn-helix domain-containing protein [Pseudorhodobacter sp.]